MSSPGASLGDLAQAYRMGPPGVGLNDEGQAILADADRFTVLVRTTGTGDVSAATRLVGLHGDGTQMWERALPDIGGRALTRTTDGGLVVAGEVRIDGFQYQGAVAQLTDDGHADTIALLGPAGANGLNAVAAIGDGSVVAGGSLSGQGWLVGLSEAQEVAWEVALPEAQEVHGVQELGDGSIVVIATADASTTDFGHASLTALTSAGAVVWTRRLPIDDRGELTALCAVGAGFAAVGHRHAPRGDATEMWVVRADERGSVVWECLLGTDRERRRGRAIVALADGGVVVAGDAVAGGKRSLRVVRLDRGGVTVWQRSINPLGDDAVRAIAATADGGVVLAGSTGSKGRRHARVLCLDTEGAVVWDQMFAQR